MKVVIIEDENAAVRNLVALLREVKPEATVEVTLDSISSVVDWFSDHNMPDLIFMDIHLADGSSFEIFEHVNITCPIIFTTAYDEYALRAFKVNSVDYLLKPIGSNDVKNSFCKLEKLKLQSADGSNNFNDTSLVNFIRSLKRQESYKKHFLIPVKGDKLLPISVDMILLFYIQDCRVKVLLSDGNEYFFPQTLDEVADSVSPSLFFRVSRQFLISREVVKDIDLWFNNRLSINLRFPVSDEKVLVSKARVHEFKKWFSSDGNTVDIL